MNIKILSFFSGKKTYLIGLAMIILGYYNNDSQMLMEGLAVITLRQGIAKVGK